jgi:hypothetical protein
MKTCPYCGSRVELYQQYFYCGFCELKIDPKDVQENGKRKNLLPQAQPSHDTLHKSVPELMRLTTIELLCLLKMARKERSNVYGERYVFIQAMKEGAQEFQEGEQATFQGYEYWTRKCFQLENLIRERIGYIPKQLTDSYLQTLASKMIQSTKKDMVIKQAQETDQ